MMNIQVTGIRPLASLPPLSSLRGRIAHGSRLRVQASAGAESTGDNVLGQAIKQAYRIGEAETIRWGVLKKEVVPPEQGGKAITWEQYRKQTERERQRLRNEFADNLEVISYPERNRRRLVGIIGSVLTVAGATALIASHAPWMQRLWLYPLLAFSIAFIDSANQGLCTESMAGAWDVDDTGLEYMPSKELAERIQQKVIKMYIQDFAVAVAVMTLICKL